MRKCLYLMFGVIFAPLSFANQENNDVLQMSILCQQTAIKLNMSEQQMIEACGQPQSIDRDHDNGQATTELLYATVSNNVCTEYEFEFNSDDRLVDVEVKSHQVSSPY